MTPNCLNMNSLSCPSLEDDFHFSANFQQQFTQGYELCYLLMFVKFSMTLNVPSQAVGASSMSHIFLTM